METRKRRPKIDTSQFTEYIIGLKATINDCKNINAATKTNLNTLLNKLGSSTETNIYENFTNIFNNTENINSKYSVLQRFCSIVKKASIELTDAQKLDVRDNMAKYNKLINGNNRKTPIKFSDIKALINKLDGLEQLVLALYMNDVRHDYNKVLIGRISLLGFHEGYDDDMYDCGTFYFKTNKIVSCDGPPHELELMIHFSLVANPRKYLIEHNNAPATPNFVSNIIGDITERHLGKRLTITDLRKKYNKIQN